MCACAHGVCKYACVHGAHVCGEVCNFAYGKVGMGACVCVRLQSGGHQRDAFDIMCAGAAEGLQDIREHMWAHIISIPHLAAPLIDVNAKSRA